MADAGAIIQKVIASNRNPNRGHLPVLLSNIFAFFDGTAFEIARPGDGAQESVIDIFCEQYLVQFGEDISRSAMERYLSDLGANSKRIYLAPMLMHIIYHNDSRGRCH